MGKEYDFIVVGARCAGSPTAMLLARKGYRVLVVDRASFPSDTVSTHVIHAPGIAALNRWGLLDEVTATGCPPVETYSFDFGPFAIRGTPRAIDGFSAAYAPRRRCSTRSSSTLPRGPVPKFVNASPWTRSSSRMVQSSEFAVTARMVCRSSNGRAL